MLLPALARAFTLLVKLSNLKEENMKKLNYLAKLSLAAIVISGFALVSPVNSEDLKVGFVYVGPVSDHGWNYEHDQGRKAVEKALGS